MSNYKSHNADETYDEVRMRQVERWKESEMSGDEWRFSWTIELLRKGKVLASTGAHRLSDAIARLAWFRITAGESGDFDSSWRDRERVEGVCMQPGCAEVATVTLRLKEEYSERGEGPLPPSPLGQPLRRFCERHSSRGDCAREDADHNYEEVTMSDHESQPELLAEPKESRSVALACLYCGTPRDYALDSNEANGVFNPFCPNGECEDRYAATL